MGVEGATEMIVAPMHALPAAVAVAIEPVVIRYDGGICMQSIHNPQCLVYTSL